MRVLTEDGALFYNHKWRVQAGLLQDRQDILRGFPVRQIIIWRRSGGINFNPGYFLPTYEVIYLIAKPHFKLASQSQGGGSGPLQGVGGNPPLGDVCDVRPGSEYAGPARQL